MLHFGVPSSGRLMFYAIAIIPGQDGTFAAGGVQQRTAGHVPEFTRLMWFYEPGEAPPCGHRSPAGNG